MPESHQPFFIFNFFPSALRVALGAESWRGKIGNSVIVLGTKGYTLGSFYIASYRR